ncbi:MAG: hypothetical protein ABEI74_02305 [Candidatus Pacearchaeota archaeon]
MKRGLLLLIFLAIVLSPAQISSEQSCALDASMVNQDPYPAVPGDYVKLVFQVEGLKDPDCGKAFFELKEKYPISFDPGENQRKTLSSGTYSKDFNSSWLIPYKVRVDKDALDSEIPMEVEYGRTGNKISLTEQFDLKVKDVRTNFEVFVKDYNRKTNLLTFEVINTGKSDAEALTMKILEQEGVEIKGSPKNVIGSLDSNDFTTAEFQIKPSKEKKNIGLEIEYTDEIGKRRSLNKTVPFNSEYFVEKKDSSTSPLVYVLIILAVSIAIYLIYRKKKS